MLYKHFPFVKVQIMFKLYKHNYRGFFCLRKQGFSSDLLEVNKK